MRNRKSILFLLLGIALLAAANLMLRLYGGDAARIVKRTSLLDAGERVSRISIVRDGKNVVMAKTAHWRLVEPFSGSADEPVVMKLLDALAFTTILDSVTDSDLLRLGRTRADLALETPRLVLSLDDGTSPAVTVSFGAKTPTGDGVYAALAGVDSVFVLPVSVLDHVDLPVDALRRRSLFVVGMDSVVSFDVRLASAARLSFSRDGELWKLDGRPASSAKVRNLLEGVLAASAVDFVWPVGATNESEIASSSLLAAYGLDSESAVTLTFKCQDGHDRQVAFGKASNESLAYALAQNGGAIVTVPIAVRDLVSREQLAYTDARLFPFEASAVRSLCLTDGDVEFVLARGEGGVWRLESPVAVPADAEAADKVLANVLTLSAADMSGKGISVSVLTNSAPVSVRRESVLGELRFEDLRSREILRVTPESVRRLVVTRAHQQKPTSVVYGRERGAWNVESSERPGTVDAKAVSRLLAALSPLVSKRIVKIKVAASDLDAYGLGVPYLTLAVDLERGDAVRRNILIGEVTPGGRFATVGSSDAVFVISNEDVAALEAQLVSE